MRSFPVEVHAGPEGAPQANPVQIELQGTQSQGVANWADLRELAYDLVPALAIVAVAALFARRKARRSMLKGWLWAPLEGLDSGWSFKDSWAANLSLGGAVVTGLFAASDILKGILGFSPAPALAVMSVAGIIATGMAGGAALVTLTFTKGGAPRTWAVLVAATVALGGAIGQLVVIGEEASTFSFGAWAWAMVAPALAAMALYGYFSVYHLITEHDIEPPPTAPSDTILGAALISLLLEQPPDGRTWPAPDAVRSRATDLIQSTERDTALFRAQLVYRSGGLPENRLAEFGLGTAGARVAVTDETLFAQRAADFDGARRPSRRRAALI